MHKQKKAFTLVELIVVITILAILGTISFISLSGYSEQARDSTRVADTSSIKTSLELFQLESGKYPLPTNLVPITYSGAVVWNQGTFGKTLYANVDKLDKIPLDPLTDKEYTYSVMSNRNEYELGGLIEGDEVAINTTQNKSPLPHLLNGYRANAGVVMAIAYTTGNYNGQIAKSLSGTTCDMIGVPTIIANDVETSTDLLQIVNNKRLVYNGYNNLPASFKTSKFKYDGGFDFTTTKLVSYTDTGSCEQLTNKTNSGTQARVNLLKGLQDTYSGTIVQNNGEIKNILTLNINTSSPSSEVLAYSVNFVNNKLGGNIEYTSNSLVYPCGIGYGWNGGSCVLATECTTGLTEITLLNGQTWSCMNLGATEVWNGSLSASDCGGTPTNCNSGLTRLGNYYQWGRNEPVTGSFITNTYSGTLTSGNVGNNDMYKGDASYGDWWQNEVGSITPTRWSGTNPQGPCPVGWHIPNNNDWQIACNTLVGTTCTNGMTYNSLLSNKLKLPFAGSRHWSSGNFGDQLDGAYYWSSDSNSTNAFNLTMHATTYMSPASNHNRSYAYPIRCIKN